MGGQDGPNIALYTGPLFIACLLSYFLAGCAFIQAVCFFQATRISKRHAYSVALVSTVLVVEMVSLAMTTIGAYHILCVAIPGGDLSLRSPLVALGLVTLNTFIAVCVQGHFALRIRMLSQGSLVGSIIAVVLAMLGLVEISASVGMTYFAAVASGKLDKLTHDVQHSRVLMAWFISTALADIISSLALVRIYLRFRKHTERQQSKSWLNSLIRHTVENGAVTSVGAILHFAFYVSLPDNLIHLAIAYVTVRLYSNVLFASINANRRVQRDIMTPTDSSVSLPDPSTGDEDQRPTGSRSGSSSSVRGRNQSVEIRSQGTTEARLETVEFTQIESSIPSGSGDYSSPEQSA